MAQDRAAEEAADQHVAAVNLLARQHYTKATQAALSAAGPVIVVEPDTVTLRHRSAEQRETHTSPRYHRLKALGHVALGTYALLIPRAGAGVDGGADPAFLAEVAGYRAAVAGLAPHIAVLGLRWDDANRQREIVDKSMALLDRVLAQRRVSVEGLRAYADDVGPALLGNAYDAAGLQLDALHATVTRWRAAMTDDERARLHVVVLGPGRPREGHPALEYFTRLLGPAASGHVVAAENLRDAAGGLDLLATSLVDRGVAEFFFADAERMQRGLLTDATQRHLDRLLGDAPR
jgi:hypothetical protein